MTAPTPTAALTPEELAARVGWPHESGMRLCGEKDIAAAIRQHSEAQAAEIERLNEQNADLEKAALTAYENGVEHAFEAAKEKAEAASQERERVMREYVTATEYWKLDPHDAKERTAFLSKIAALSAKEASDER